MMLGGGTSPDESFPRPRGLEIAGCVALCLGFFALYANSVDLEATNTYFYNFLFDADAFRVTSDVQYGQHPTIYERHPLFLTVIAPVSDALVWLGSSRNESVRLVVSAYAALGVFLSWFLFRRICSSSRDAFLFTFLHGVAAARWLMAAIPDTFAVNATFICVAFFLSEPRFAQPIRRPLAFGINVVVSALAIGLTAPNAAYVALAQLSANYRAHASQLRRIYSLLGFVAATATVLVLMIELQSSLFTERIRHETDFTHVRALVSRRDPFLDFTRPFVPAEVAKELRSFTIDTLVAPRLSVEVVDTIEGPQQMVQFGSWATPLYGITLAVFLGLLVPLLPGSTLGKAARSPDAQLAFAFILFNLALHYGYRANGQPVIFSAHTALPLLVLISHLYAYSQFSYRHTMLLATCLAVTVNNAWMFVDLDKALRLACADGARNVCSRWKGDDVEERFQVGQAAYQSSAFYWLDRGDEALKAKQSEIALDFFHKAEERDPDFHQVHRSLGIALGRLGRREDAVKHLERALELEPSDEGARHVLRQLSE